MTNKPLAIEIALGIYLGCVCVISCISRDFIYSAPPPSWCCVIDSQFLSKSSYWRSHHFQSCDLYLERLWRDSQSKTENALDYFQQNRNSRLAIMFRDVGWYVPKGLQLAFVPGTKGDSKSPSNHGRGSSLLVYILFKYYSVNFFHWQQSACIYRIGLLWKWVYTKGRTIRQVQANFASIFTIQLIRMKMKDLAHKQGMGRHRQKEVIEMGMKDLRSFSRYLG